MEVILNKLIVKADYLNAHPQIEISKLSKKHLDNLTRFMERKEQLEPNTLKSLELNFNKFTNYCEQQGAYSLPLEDATILEQFIISEYERGCKSQTLRVYAWAVSKMHEIVGLEIPFFKSIVSARLKIIGKLELANGINRKQAAPFTYEHLKFINEHINYDCDTSIRNAVILNLSYDGLLRESEVCNLFTEQLSKHNNLFSLNITNTKTDKSLDGSIVNLSQFTSALLVKYLCIIAHHRGKYLIKRTAPKTRKIVQLKNSESVPNKLDTKVTPKTIESVFIKSWNQIKDHNESISDHSKKVSLPDYRFSGHSARVGAACDLVSAGVDDSVVMRAGRWKTLQMVELYTRRVSNKFATVREFRDRLENMVNNANDNYS